MTHDLIRPFHTETAKPFGYCIYCGSEEELTKEHVIPYFLAGSLVLPAASCSKCSNITKGFEDNLAYSIFFALRRRLNVQSRSQGGPPDCQILVEEGGKLVEKHVAFDELPPIAAWPVFEAPGIALAREPSNDINLLAISFGSLERGVSKNITYGRFVIEVDLHLFMRLMAKMGHGIFMAYKQMGAIDDSWEPLLADAVRFGHFLPYYIGTVGSPSPGIEKNGPNGQVHRPLQLLDSESAPAEQDPNSEYMMYTLEPFCPGMSPQYGIVVGRRRIGPEGTEQMKLPVSPDGQFQSPGKARIHIDAQAI